MEKEESSSCERKEVIIIGNGPSAIVLSYLLSGHIPYWNGCPVSNDCLNMKLEQYVQDKSLLEQDLKYLSDGLEGHSRNPVSLLVDHLLHPDADLGANLQSKIKWRHDSSFTIDHLCLGRHGIGGIWNHLRSKQLQTISMANWMDLPNYSMNTFRQQRRTSQTLRATYEEIHAYYIHYVKRNCLIEYFRNGYEVTSIERIYLNNQNILWEIRGYQIENHLPFVLQTKYIVLASGISHRMTRPLGISNECLSQSFTYTNFQQIEDLILKSKCLTSESKPLLVIGCGLTAIDVILLCQEYFIPILHVFRRSIDDYELVFNQLPASIYPEYERLKDLMKQSSSSSSSNCWSYQCFAQSEIVSITENHFVHIRNLRTQSIIDHQISFVARLTGTELDLSYFSLFNRKQPTKLYINPYTYECLEFENIYAIGALVGDKLVRFLQGGAFACAANLLKKIFDRKCRS